MRYLPTILFLAATAAFSSLSAQDGATTPAPAPAGPWPEMQKPAASDATALQIIGLHLQARGGADALRAQRSVRLKGTLVEGKNDYALTLNLVAPGRLLLESVRTHMGDDYKTVSACGAGSAWRQEVTPKRKNPEPLDGLERQLLELDAMLPFLFIDPAANGHVFAYRGEQTFAKRKVYVLHGWLANGLRIEALFDAETFQALAIRHAYRIGPKELLVDRVPTGFARLGKVWWENGHALRTSGKVFRTVKWTSVKDVPAPPAEVFNQPPTRERWLRGSGAE